MQHFLQHLQQTEQLQQVLQQQQQDFNHSFQLKVQQHTREQVAISLTNLLLQQTNGQQLQDMLTQQVAHFIQHKVQQHLTLLCLQLPVLATALRSPRRLSKSLALCRALTRLVVSLKRR